MNKDNCFEIRYQNKTIYFCAETKEEMDEWISVVEFTFSFMDGQILERVQQAKLTSTTSDHQSIGLPFQVTHTKLIKQEDLPSKKATVIPVDVAAKQQQNSGGSKAPPTPPPPPPNSVRFQRLAQQQRSPTTQSSAPIRVQPSGRLLPKPPQQQQQSSSSPPSSPPVTIQKPKVQQASTSPFPPSPSATQASSSTTPAAQAASAESTSAGPSEYRRFPLRNPQSSTGQPQMAYNSQRQYSSMRREERPPAAAPRPYGSYREIGTKQ